MPLWSVLFSPAINLTKGFKLYYGSESLFFLFAFTLDILAMCTFISLNVLETTLAVPYGIELRSGYTAVRCTTCFLRHVLSPFFCFYQKPTNDSSQGYEEALLLILP